MRGRGLIGLTLQFHWGNSKKERFRTDSSQLDTVFPYIADESEDDYVSRLITRVEESRQLARIRTLEAQHRDKTRYDARHRSVSYRPGELVWVFMPDRKVGLSEKKLRRYFLTEL
ncbi:transposon Ty3-I Gag-Pol polyprotein [Trichonephila clavipes]|nr:transposon Ty3-I Gag-Pol polyprotein [Trichonephila clavipes]